MTVWNTHETKDSSSKRCWVASRPKKAFSGVFSAAGLELILLYCTLLPALDKQRRRTSLIDGDNPLSFVVSFVMLH